MNKIILLSLTILFLIFPGLIHAQNSGINVSSGYEIADPEAVTGDILVYTNEGLKRTTTAYDKDTFGVLDEGAIFTLETDSTTEKPVTTSGIAQVNVTSAGGAIKTGDRITTSSIAGKGQKAIISGIVLGVAMADYDGPSGQVGQIPVTIAPTYLETTSARSTVQLFDKVGSSIFQNAQDPRNFGQLLRYFVAGLVALTGFVSSFLTFSGSVPKSIDAVGRNPLAKNSIYFAMGVNIVFSITITIIGIGAAFVILRL